MRAQPRGVARISIMRVLPLRLLITLILRYRLRQPLRRDTSFSMPPYMSAYHAAADAAAAATPAPTLLLLFASHYERARCFAAADVGRRQRCVVTVTTIICEWPRHIIEYYIHYAIVCARAAMMPEASACASVICVWCARAGV